VKARLAELENRHRIDNQKDTGRPTLRRATPTDTSNGGTNDNGDGRPTLKRHDQ
jgi:hypothetical protein